GRATGPAPVATSKQSRRPAGNGAFTMTGTAVAPEPVTPSGWDPLAAGPSGWDLPEPPEPPKPAIPMPPQPRAPRHHSKVGGVTFSLAVLTAGAGVLANLEGVDWFTARHIVGLTLAVVGLGLVVGAFVRGGRGLIGLAIPLSIAGM